MVILKVKYSETDIFIFKTTCSENLDKIITEVAKIHNLRVLLREFVRESKELSKFGVFKTSTEEKCKEMESSNTTEEPTGKRCGIPPVGEPLKTLLKEIQNCEDSLSVELVRRGEAVDPSNLKDCLSSLMAAIKICYPMNLPKEDPIFQIIQPDWKHKEMHDSKTVEMWFCSRKLAREKCLSSIKSVGKNERSKLIVKLRKSGSGAPVSEPVVDQETQKKLLSYYYKKQEMTKKLLENEEDFHLNSEWADPKGLSKDLQGIRKVNFK